MNRGSASHWNASLGLLSTKRLKTTELVSLFQGFFEDVPDFSRFFKLLKDFSLTDDYVDKVFPTIS